MLVEDSKYSELEVENFGVIFKKGKTHYYEDKSIKYKSKVCKCKKLHLKKVNKPDSLPADAKEKKEITKVRKKPNWTAKRFINSDFIRMVLNH